MADTKKRVVVFHHKNEKGVPMDFIFKGQNYKPKNVTVPVAEKLIAKGCKVVSLKSD